MATAESPRTAVLLVNLGTPDAPTPAAIRRYLAEFLSDPRVIEVPKLIWLPILYGFILTFRPPRLAHAYESVWTTRGSPLLAGTVGLSQGMQDELQRRGLRDVAVVPVMRYGNPSIRAAVSSLAAEGVQRFVVLPLFPQYSATTTASAWDAVWDELKTLRDVPAVTTVHDYHADPRYIRLLADSVRAYWHHHGRGDHLLLSFHGLPQRYVDKGDPYREQCATTARLLAEALELGAGGCTCAFQSRFGREPWLQPYTDVVIPQIAQAGARRIDALCPGFPVDCLETLEEVALRYGELAQEHGAELRYIPALNDSTAHAVTLAELVQPLLG